MECAHRLGHRGAKRWRLARTHDRETHGSVERREVAILEPSRLPFAQVQAHHAHAVLHFVVQRGRVTV